MPFRGGYGVDERQWYEQPGTEAEFLAGGRLLPLVGELGPISPAPAPQVPEFAPGGTVRQS